MDLQLEFHFSQEIWVSKASSGFHGSLYVSMNAHTKFHALHYKFTQSIAQMFENQLY